MAVGQKILSVREIGALLKVAQGTVYKLVKEGKIPAFKIGKNWRLRADEIRRWLAEQAKGAPQ